MAALLAASLLAAPGGCVRRAAAPPAAGPPGGHEPARTAWVYDLPDLAPADVAPALDRLARRGVSRLFLSIEHGPRSRLDEPASRAAVARVREAAAERGLGVHAMLLQDPRWLGDEAGARRRVAAAAAFGEAPGERPFDGLHLDVEPHTLDAWECSGPDGRAGLLARLAKLAAAARDVALGVRPGGLRVSAAVPWWIFEEETREALAAARELAAAVDELVLMAYGEPGGPVVGGDADRLACRLGLPERFSQVPRGTRLSVGLAAYEYPTPAALDAAAGRLDARLAAEPRYGGVALFLDGGPPGMPLVVSLRGRVLDGSGRPARGTAVIATTEESEGGVAAATTANACGRFVLRLRRPGAVRLSVVPAGRPPGSGPTLEVRGLVAGREREVGTIVVGEAGEPESLPPDPALPPEAPLLARARALAAARENDLARGAFGSLLARRPGHLEARLGLARLEAWQGRADRAAAAYRAILGEHCHAAEALLGLADLARWDGRLDEAARLYAEVARDWSHEPAGFLGLARVALARGRPAEAAALADHALALDPSDAEAQALRARARETAR